MDTFEIYQVKPGIEFRNYRFENIEGLDAFDLKVELYLSIENSPKL